MVNPILPLLEQQMHQDPLLPRAQSTTAFWQIPAHRIASIQSEQPPTTTDFAIIGSGVTGCSVAKTLLELPETADNTVALFEARDLTSGATGRNGGHLVSDIPEKFGELSSAYGPEMAAKIARCCNRTLSKVHELAESSPSLQKAGEVRKLQSIGIFLDIDTLVEARESVKQYLEHVPEERAHCYFMAEEEVKGLGVPGAVGAFVCQAGGLWPYRLVTEVFAELYEQHASRFSIETNTSVVSLGYNADGNAQYPYILETSRGLVRANKVIHCTNGYSGHLLPKLRGNIWPLRGTMSTQEKGPSFPVVGNERSWAFMHKPRFDPGTDSVELGLYYMQQNGITGDIFIGGEKVHINELLTSDDTTISATSEQNIKTYLPKTFPHAWKDERGEVVPAKARMVWSGIMGFTADSVPMVGKVPPSLSGRGREGGEWIAAGFNGNGMAHCWGCGEAVARMAAGQVVPDWLPEVFLLDEARLTRLKEMDAASMFAKHLIAQPYE